MHLIFYVISCASKYKVANYGLGFENPITNFPKCCPEKGPKIGPPKRGGFGTPPQNGGPDC